uniref:Uncharacterized protein n=1 Tax=Trichuris muris TaxID=70415 RepID=A0A5S6Q7J9_TRIMR
MSSERHSGVYRRLPPNVHTSENHECLLSLAPCALNPRQQLSTLNNDVKIYFALSRAMGQSMLVNRGQKTHGAILTNLFR